MTQSQHLEHFAQSATGEWYTPKVYVDAAREVMGSIETDPASCDLANQVFVGAEKYFTIETNGLIQRWEGNVWLNPPYGWMEDCEDDVRTSGFLPLEKRYLEKRISSQMLWSHLLIAQYKAGVTKQAVLLVTAATSESWFRPLWDYPICFTDHRIHFVDENLQVVKQNTKGSALVYLGENRQKFADVFRRFGPVVTSVAESLGEIVTERESFASKRKK